MIKLNEARVFNKGEKVKFIHPSGLDRIPGIINREANSKEINKMYDRPSSDRYYVIDVVHNGKKDQTVIASSMIFKESFNAKDVESKLDKFQKSITVAKCEEKAMRDLLDHKNISYMIDADSNPGKLIFKIKY